MAVAPLIAKSICEPFDSLAVQTFRLRCGSLKQSMLMRWMSSRINTRPLAGDKGLIFLYDRRNLCCANLLGIL